MKYFILFLMIFSSYETYAQCCAAGNPISNNSNVSSSKFGSFEIAFSNQYSYSDTYYEGSEVSDFKYIDNSYFNFSSISFSFGISENIKLLSELGYFHTKYQQFDFGEDFKPERNADGLADASIGLLYHSYQNDDNTFGVYQSFKMTIPVGEFDKVDGSVLLPIDIQPSSGNYKYDIGLSLVKTFRNFNDLTFILSNNYELSQFIETSRTNYKYGNQYNLSLLAIYKLNDFMNTNLQFRYNNRGKALAGTKNEKAVEYKYVESTGGHVVFLSPQIDIKIYDDLRTTLQFDIPIYKNMNGLQLTNNYAFSFRFSKSLSIPWLNSENKVLLNDNYSEYNVKVYGECGMCKDRIENLVLTFENVKSAEWDNENMILKIKYSNKLPHFDKIEKALANIGHDTDKYKATDEAYNALHECCKYRK